ncbi:MAG: hypothetical protein IKX74_03760 [Erysipelotrichaceae bacterium]|nr:hypothetical protein [Erysipelotrichaceae bacterium]MBR5048741.1 hypothetical protein [Erysipelotrichaceae bacterium]
MVEKVYFVQSDSINPYHNQALQRYLFEHIPDNSMILMLWKNIDTVTIGNQQNAYIGLNVNSFEMEHTYLARKENPDRIVYSDLGCLNFSFMVYQNNYNVVNQINVIYQALSQLGLSIYLDSDNEIMMGTSRITDSCFVNVGERCQHSGTIYWDADKSKRSRLVRDEKAKTGLGNITDVSPLISMDMLTRKILQSLADRYGPVYQLSIAEDLEELTDRFRSLRYIYQTDRPYTLILNDTYDAGHLVIYVDMLRRSITSISVYSDTTDDVQFSETLNEVFDGLRIDDVLFRRRLSQADDRYRNDITRIYETIRRESYSL